MGKPNEGDKGEINIQNKNKTPIQMRLSQVQAMAEQKRSSASAIGVIGGLAFEVNPATPSPPPGRRIVMGHIGGYPFLRFRIRRPPPNVWPDNYLLDNLENIREEINTSPILRATLGGRHFIAYISGILNFKGKLTGGDRVIKFDQLQKLAGNGMRILPTNKILSEQWMRTLFTNLRKRCEEERKKERTFGDHSEIEYIYANRIEICIEANTGTQIRTWGKEELI